MARPEKKLEPVEFSEMLKWLKLKKKTIRVPTLGDNSYIDFSSPKDNMIHIVGKNGGQNDMDGEYWDYVCDVIRKIKYPQRRDITTNFSGLKRNRISPSVPALCWAYCEEKKGNIVWKYVK